MELQQDDKRVKALRLTLEACAASLEVLPPGGLNVIQFENAAKLAYKLAYSTLPGGSISKGDPGCGMQYGWVKVARFEGEVLELGKDIMDDTAVTEYQDRSLVLLNSHHEKNWPR